MRKFTIGKLEIRKVSINDWLWLVFYSVFIIVAYYFRLNEDAKAYKTTLLFGSMTAGWIVLNSQIGLRFRSVYFSLIWFIISLIIVRPLIPLTYYPLSTFLLYHALRLIFWYKYDREFIPFIWGRGELYRRMNNIEHQGGSAKDKYFTKWLISIGLIIFMMFLICMIGFKL